MVKQSRETRQKELIQEIVEKTKGFFSAEEIFEIAKKKESNIGIATVYRFLKDLRKKNKLYSYTCERRILYSQEKKSHCHFICEKTGKVIHFDIDNLDFLKGIKEKIPGTISSFQLEIKGVCDECSDE